MVNVTSKTVKKAQTKPYKPHRCLNCEAKDKQLEQALYHLGEAKKQLKEFNSDNEDAIYTAIDAYKNKKNPKSIRQVKRWRKMVEGGQ